MTWRDFYDEGHTKVITEFQLKFGHIEDMAMNTSSDELDDELDLIEQQQDELNVNHGVIEDFKEQIKQYQKHDKVS